MISEFTESLKIICDSPELQLINLSVQQESTYHILNYVVKVNHSHILSIDSYRELRHNLVATIPSLLGGHNIDTKEHEQIDAACGSYYWVDAKILIPTTESIDVNLYNMSSHARSILDRKFYTVLEETLSS